MTSTTTTVRAENIHRVMAIYPSDTNPNADALVESTGDRAYLLVERDVRGGTHWLSTHRSLDDASTYHLGQEARENWEPLVVVDLDSGEAFSPTYVLQFTWSGTIGEMGA